MFTSLPDSTVDFKTWPWDRIAPYYDDLAARPLDAATGDAWLHDWDRLARLLNETFQRLYVATTVNTADAEAQRRFNAFLDEIYPAMQSAEQRLKKKLLASGLEPAGFAVPLRNMRAEADLFREANLPLLSQELKLTNEYDKVIGDQTIVWDGQERTMRQLLPILQDPDRGRRERAWRAAAERQLADRETINQLWVQLLEVRRKLAENAGRPDYRTYRWQQMLRFDYTPEDCESFHQAIEAVVVPAATRVYERRRQQLGLDSLRPWDTIDGWWQRPIDSPGLLPLKPYTTFPELKEKTSRIFHQVDPKFGEYFDVMRREDLLDLDNRKGKAPGGYCIDFVVERRPFIFTNAVGLHDDVQTMLHEGGHSFHAFEYFKLPYLQQMQVSMEMAEVASMGMELLASPYLEAERGGFYTEAEAARARIEHMEEILLFWPFMAVVDSFQHWAYTHPQAAAQPSECDAAWAERWRRFIPGMDWSGLEEAMMTGWHRKPHILSSPFYYVEYGLARLGAVQVWRNALQDQAAAVVAYRQALSLGATRPLPELFAAAGARFAFDAPILRMAVELVEGTINELEEKID